MNAAQIHLALNHVPLFLSLLGGGILLLGAVKKNQSFISLSFYMLVAAALFTAPVFLTGEGTEEIVEKMPGVNEAAIEEHEEMAKIALIVIIISGVIALAGIIFRKNPGIARIILVAAVIGSLASFGTMAQTAHLGGKIRHTELGSAAAGENGGNEKENEDEENGENKAPVTDVSKPAPADSINAVNEKPVKKDDEDDD